MNIKQGKMGGSRHLNNSIRYIMNPKKTEDGKLIGGNAGRTPEEVYQTMMDTKADWDKMEGRQGYHFVLSFKPGETNEETAYKVIQEFCEEYLGDNYDYVFSIHNDHEHMHGHIVFNSVNRVNSYKYRYENGDWKKYIQPITDRICQKHGLPPLEFDEQTRNGKSYAQWEADKKGKPNWKKIIRADIDYIISISENETEFISNMQEIGYQIRKGNSEKHGTYFAIKALEQKRAWRSYNLGNGYNYSEILSRLGRNKFVYKNPKSPKIRYTKIQKTIVYSPMLEFRKKRIRKIYYVTYRYHNRMKPYKVDHREVRKSLLHINQLWENINYLNRNHIDTYEELLNRENELIEKEKALKNQKYSTDFLGESEEYLRYKSLQEKLKQSPEYEDEFEKILDELEELAQILPDAVLEGKDANEELDQQLQSIRREKRIIKHIKKEEEEDKLFHVRWGQPTGRTQQKNKKKEVHEQWAKAK